MKYSHSKKSVGLFYRKIMSLTFFFTFRVFLNFTVVKFKVQGVKTIYRPEAKI